MDAKEHGENVVGTLEELSTTVDPSYVIQLIRKMLPPVDADKDVEMENADIEEKGTTEYADDEGKDTTDDPREEAGCVLWDLAANESIAQLMVDNCILDVLLGMLQVPYSNRMQEICMGILANMACHKNIEKQIANKEGMLSTIVEQLYSTDTQTLVETCRLLNVGLHSEECNKWIEMIKSDDVLEHLFWIAQNTLNLQLIEKIMELFRSMVDSSKAISSHFLPSLIRLDILRILTNIITSQLNPTMPRNEVLDITLQVALEISLSDGFSQYTVGDEELISSVLQVIRISWMDDIGLSALTAMVLLANLITERPSLANEICQEPVLVDRLLALVPDDSSSRNALWSIINSICKCITVDNTEIINIVARGSVKLIDDTLEDDNSTLETKMELLRVLKDYLTVHEQDMYVKEACELLEQICATK